MYNFHNISANTVNYIKSASQAQQISLYSKLRIKFGIAERNIWFNSECIKNAIIPNYVKIKSNDKSISAQNSIKKAQKFWLQNELRGWYKKRDGLGFYIFILHTQLTNRLHSIEWDALDSKIRDNMTHILYKKTEKQQKKLNDLKARKNTVQTPHIDVVDHPFAKRVQNLSSVTFEKEEETLLGKGSKYCVERTKNKDIEILAANLEKYEDIRNDRILSTKCAEAILKNRVQSRNINTQKERNVLKSIEDKVRTNDLIITKADKGNCTVVLNKVDYVEKVDSFIQENNFQKLDKDPTENFNKMVKSTVSNSKTIFDDWEVKRLNIMNPQTPRFFGLPKLHKVNVPIRPVVSYVNSPCYKLAYKINTIFRSKTSFRPEFGVKNSTDLAERLKDIRAPRNYKMVSFDVENLFTSVPVQESLQVAENILRNKNIDEQEISELMDNLKICTDQNFFKFNGVIYKQTEGLAMGSPLSPLLADIFMDNFEKRIFSEDKFKQSKQNIVYWFRYVDDIICLWKGTNRQLDNFFKQLNSTHKNIKFKMELEENQSINFLDLTISHNEDIHEFKIYRKPTYTDTVIPHESCHPQSHKMATFNSMVDRLLKIPQSPQNFNKESKIIMNIAMNNGFKENMISNLIKNRTRKMIVNNVFPIEKIVDEEKWVSLPYLGAITEHVGKVLKKAGFKVAYTTDPLLRKLFTNSKDKIDIRDRNGIYKLKCGDCNSSYVGQTGRKFSSRIKEHVRSWVNNKDNSNFALHLNKENHSFNPEVDVEFLHVVGKSKLMTTLEILEIRKLERDMAQISLNDQINFNNFGIINLLI
jgi:hypothetical protein